MSKDKHDLTVAEAAELLSLSERKVWEMVRWGDLDSYKVGRARRIRRDSFETLRAGQDAA